MKNKDYIFCSFFMGEIEVAVDVASVQEVVNYPENIIKLPLSPSYLVGVFNLRNTIIPIVNLKLILKDRDSEVSQFQKVAIADYDGAKIGLLFDSTSEIIRIQKDQVNNFSYNNSNDENVIAGVLKLEEGKRIIQVLSPHALLKIDNIPQIVEKQTNTGTVSSSDWASGVRKKCIVFTVSDLKMCFEISRIREIIRIPDIQESAVKNPLCLGIVNLRGRTIPIIDLGLLLKSRDKVATPTSESRVVIYKMDREYFGLLVDSVESINSYLESDIMAIPLLENARSQMFLGCLSIKDLGDVILIDDQKILSNGEIEEITQGHAHIYRNTEINEKSLKTSKRESYITFRLDHLFGVSIGDVREIINYTKEIKPAPGSPRFVKGIMNLRGKIITVIDTRTLYQMPPSKNEATDLKIMIFENEGEHFGLVVDSLESILTVSEAHKQNVPSLLVKQVKDSFGNDIKEILTLGDAQSRESWEDVLFVLSVLPIAIRLKNAVAA